MISVFLQTKNIFGYFNLARKRHGPEKLYEKEPHSTKILVQILHSGINTEKLWTQIIPNLWDYTICMGVGSLTICNRVQYFGTPSKYSLGHNGITFVICLLECAYWHVALRYSWHKYMKDSPFKIWGHLCRWLARNFQALERNKWKYSRTL